MHIPACVLHSSICCSVHVIVTSASCKGEVELFLSYYVAGHGGNSELKRQLKLSANSVRRKEAVAKRCG